MKKIIIVCKARELLSRLAEIIKGSKLNKIRKAGI